MPEVLLGKRKIHHSIVKERVRDYYNAAAAATATAAGEEKKKRREEKRREEEQAGSVFLPPAAVGIPSEEVPVFVLSSVAGKFQGAHFCCELCEIFLNAKFPFYSPVIGRM
jgi:hypothetical protein